MQVRITYLTYTDASDVQVWVTYLTCLPNVSMIAVSSTSLAITFYDISGSNNFRPVVAITHLETCASVMTYWTNPSGTSQLLWGDTRGNVSCVVLAGGALVTFLQPSLKKTNNEISRVSFSDILTGKVGKLVDLLTSFLMTLTLMI